MWLPGACVRLGGKTELARVRRHSGAWGRDGPSWRGEPAGGCWEGLGHRTAFRRRVWACGDEQPPSWWEHKPAVQPPQEVRTGLRSRATASGSALTERRPRAKVSCGASLSKQPRARGVIAFSSLYRRRTPCRGTAWSGQAPGHRAQPGLSGRSAFQQPLPPPGPGPPALAFLRAPSQAPASLPWGLVGSGEHQPDGMCPSYTHKVTSQKEARAGVSWRRVGPLLSTNTNTHTVCPAGPSSQTPLPDSHTDRRLCLVHPL